jgi:hypothetical protein
MTQNHNKPDKGRNLEFEADYYLEEFRKEQQPELFDEDGKVYRANWTTPFHTLETMLKVINNLDAHRQHLQSDLASLRSEIERLKGYVQHKPDCKGFHLYNTDRNFTCTCGLEPAQNEG